MRFLFFNVAVIAALVYLIGADRDDMQNAADRIYDTVADVKETAREYVAGLDDSPPADAKPPARDEGPEAAAAEPRLPIQRARTEASPAPEPGPPERIANSESLPPVSDPAVARRRAEVLEGIVELDAAPAVDPPPAPVTPSKVALAQGEVLMSHDARRRELYALAEEMELLFVTKAAR
jgi:hypothetical protein